MVKMCNVDVLLLSTSRSSCKQAFFITETRRYQELVRIEGIGEGTVDPDHAESKNFGN